MIEQILKETDSKMQKTINALIQELSTIRTGRATPALVEHIKVDYHGVPTPVNQIASISAPEPRLLVIHPYDKSCIPDVEKALTQSDLGLVPSNDGEIIRLPFPQLTEERRLELTKVAKGRAEEGRVAIRNLRRELIDDLRQQEKGGKLTKDDLHRGMEEAQDLTDKYVGEIDELLEQKEKELMEI